MAGTVADLKEYFNGVKDNMGEQIGYLWADWNNQRSTKIEEWKELRHYVFATDTSTTSNQTLEWKNSTTVPKLCQIRDNLHANYISSIFPNDNWLQWRGNSVEDQKKARVIEAYMRDKAHQSKVRNLISELLYDYIDYGNCFATVEHVRDSYTLPNGRTVIGYEGPRIVRISPLDIVFNPVAPSFQQSPKIVRTVKTLGELKSKGEIDENWKKAYEKTVAMRDQAGTYTREDTDKAVGFSVDGFGDMHEYYGSAYVEVLIFKGDYYDHSTHTLEKNKEIVVIDRSITVYHGDNDSWLGGADIIHVGWRKRPDNLYSMGPLDNLVGMQYRIDHLENLKADAMDLIVHPPLKQTGDVEPFEWGPGEVISILQDGDLEEMGKSLQGILSAQNEIAALEARMEEYAGAPKQAMGIRTPGEKTAFEVQQLENAAGRIFQEKVINFEVNGFEPLMNLMLAVGRDKFTGSRSLRAVNQEFGVEEFLSVQPEDLVANGTLRPIGARHFGEQAQLIQNLTSLFNSPLGQMVQPHWSAENTAKLIEDALGLDRYNLVRKDVGLVEASERQDTANHLEQVVAERQVAPS